MQVDLRDYQWEVVQPALQGKNIIVWLPTGAGKTRAAVFVARHHLDSRRQGKVAVLVNKVPLVNQHYEQEFKPALTPRYKVIGVTGDTELKEQFAYIVRMNDVIICTAQILQNSLTSTEEEKHVELTEFSLLIIDECHHTQKNGVYNKIMAQYIEAKYNNVTSLPQVLGLTASPGTDGANTIDKAMNHILQICANMDAQLIMSSSKYKPQLDAVVPQVMKSYDVTEERKQDPFGDKIKVMMSRIHNHISESSMTRNFGSQTYEQAVVELEKTGAIESNRVKRVCALHLRKYNDALLINDTVQMVDALCYLEEFYRTEERMKVLLDQTDRFLFKLFDDNIEELFLLANDKENENPKLNSLENILMKQFKTPNSQGIIFTKTRQSAHALFGWIKNSKQLMASEIRPGSLTGAGVSSQTKHMTQQEQQAVIQKFRTGEINLLVATSVAEEGLDIKACNIVIRYGLITNEISMVQARGRARAENSVYSVIAEKGGKEMRREFVNEFRECLMEGAIQNVQRMSERDYQIKIRDLQLEGIMSQKLKDLKQDSMRMENLPEHVRFCCRNCNQAVCLASDLRIIEGMHHVNVNPNFKIYYKVLGKVNLPKKFEDWEPGGIVACIACGQHWGMQIIYKKAPIPGLCIKNFVVELPNERRPFKKWKSVPCQIQDFNYIEYCNDNILAI